MSDQNKVERALDWDDTIDANADEFAVLEPGEYDFTVKGFERVRFAGSAKLPTCWQAKVALDVEGSTVTHNLFLHTKCEGLLCAFFKGIGAREHGDRLEMNWNKIAGATGRCVIATRKWTDKNGETRENSEVKKFILPTDKIIQPATPALQAIIPASELNDDIPF